MTIYKGISDAGIVRDTWEIYVRMYNFKKTDTQFDN